MRKMGKQWVVKDNRYIEARFTNYQPTLAQNRVVLWLASLVHSRQDENFELVECTTNELRTVMGVGHNNERLAEELAVLRSATAIMKKDQVWTIFGIIDVAQIDGNTNMVQLQLGSKMKPFLLKLGDAQEGFTRIELDKIQGMRSVHSQRIYELLNQYRNLARGDTRLIKLETLKDHLGLRIKRSGKLIEKLPRWPEFERNVLRQAEKDLCNAGMFIFYEAVKKGRKVVAVRFHFSVQKDEKGVTLPLFLTLQLTGLTQFEKVQISNCNEPAAIEKAIIEADRSDSLEPLKKLIPKSHKERNIRMRSLIESSIFSENATAGDEKETELF